MPKALVLRAPGTNCDQEMLLAFQLAGAEPELMHIERAIARPSALDDYDLFGFPGGFSYGDDIASGRIFAMKIRSRLYPALRNAVERGCPMIGACNGFQVLVQTGLLPGPSGSGRWLDTPPRQTVALTENVGGRFVDRWVGVEVNRASPCIWTKGISEQWGTDRDVLQLPVAHGEGRFVTMHEGVLSDLESTGQVALRYTDNYNASENAIAGICDPTGMIFGLMPHPERYLAWTRHPYWTRLSPETRARETPGLAMFKNAVAAVSPARTLSPARAL